MLEIRGPHFETHCFAASFRIETYTEFVLITRSFTGCWGPSEVPQLQNFANLKYFLSSEK